MDTWGGIVLIVAKCNVNDSGHPLGNTEKNVLIVAKCNVNEKLFIIILLNLKY